MGVGQREKATQKRVIKLFAQELGYTYLGDFTERKNFNIETELLTKFLTRKGYSPVLISRALKELQDAFKNLDFKIADRDPFHELKSGLAEYKSAQDCGSIVYDTGCILRNEDDTFTYYTSYNGNAISSQYFDDGGFITPDGTLLLIEQGKQAQGIGYIVSIDVNGYKKRPNKLGHDLFMFQITSEGKVLPMGADGTYFNNQREQYCSKTSTSNNNGATCAYYALTDTNYFKNL